MSDAEQSFDDASLNIISIGALMALPEQSFSAHFLQGSSGSLSGGWESGGGCRLGPIDRSQVGEKAEYALGKQH